MTQNRQKGICNKAGFMKGGGHHYSRASCANGLYLLSFTFPPSLLFHLFSSFSLHNDPVTFAKSPPVFSRSCPVSELYGVPLLLILQMALLRGSRGCAEKEVLFAHTCRAALSDNPSSGRPTLLTSLPLCICCQILFHFHTNHLERGGRPHSAGRVLCRPCGLAQLTPCCAITPLNCWLSCCLLLSKCMVTVNGHCVSWD